MCQGVEFWTVSLFTESQFGNFVEADMMTAGTHCFIPNVWHPCLKDAAMSTHPFSKFGTPQKDKAGY